MCRAHHQFVLHFSVNPRVHGWVASSHAGGRAGGANTAASFLEEFIEEGVRWMHLDIAGASGTPNAPNAGNGWGVQTVATWLKSLE